MGYSTRESRLVLLSHTAFVIASRGNFTFQLRLL
jgi:hypothetical protein